MNQTTLVRQDAAAERPSELAQSRANAISSALLVVALALSSIAFLASIRCPLRLHWDLGLLLGCGQLVAEGKIPYIDFYELQPPLIMYLSAIPACLAQLSHTRIEICLNFCVFACSLYSVLAAGFILRSQNTKHFDLAFMVVGLALSNVFMELNYGQREHLYALLFAPYLLLRFTTWQQTKSIPGAVRLIIGLLAGLGVAIKPHFVPAFIATEVYWIVSHRSFRRVLAVESLAALAGIAGGFLFFLALNPHAWSKYTFEILPMLLQGYNYGNCLWYTVITFQYQRMVGLALAVSLAGAILLRRYSPLLMPISVWSLCGYFAYVIQHKGCDYHNIPVLVATTMLLSAQFYIIAMLAYRGHSFSKGMNDIVAVQLAFEKPLQKLCLTAAVLSVLFVGYEGYVLKKSWHQAPAYAPDAIERGKDAARILFQFAKPGDSVAFVSESFDCYPTMAQLNMHPACRHLYLFLITLSESMKRSGKGDAERLTLIENKVIEEEIADINITKPPLICLDESSSTVNALLSAHKFDERCLKGYALKTRLGPYAAYARRELSSSPSME